MTRDALAKLLEVAAIAAADAKISILRESISLVSEVGAVDGVRVQSAMANIERLKREIARQQEIIAVTKRRAARRAELEKRRADHETDRETKTEQSKSPTPAKDTTFYDQTGTVSGYRRTYGNADQYFLPGQKYVGREFAGTAIDAAGRFRGRGAGLGVAFLGRPERKPSNGRGGPSTRKQ